MKQDVSSDTETIVFQSSQLHRRKFLSQLGIATATVVGLAACTKTGSDAVGAAGNVEDLKSSATGDLAILNYAYLLEQLESAFYIKVTDSFYSGASSLEQARLSQIRDHEIAHREFFKTALGSKAIPDQKFNFSSINFSSRTSVLTAAKTFEDTGVSAYNGIAYAIESADYLLAAGKIVSVEARHAAYLRDLVQPVSFADSTVIDANGLDLAKAPTYVIRAISPYLTVMPNTNSFPYNI